MSLDRRRTYLNYLFENMTYLTELVKFSVNLYELNTSLHTFRFNNLLDGHNLSSYNKMMLIFQNPSTSYWRADSIKIVVLGKGESISITDTTFVHIYGLSYNLGSLYISFIDNEVYINGLNGSSTSSSRYVYITDLIIIGINYIS